MKPRRVGSFSESMPMRGSTGTAARGDKLPRIQNPQRVECGFEGGVDGAANGRGRLRPPALLGQADAVFAGDDAAPGEHLREKLVERRADFLLHRAVRVVARG